MDTRAVFMGYIKITKLEVSGEKGTSSIEFGEHLTIIAGPSDTGKSYIFKCIDYLFGADSTSLPFSVSIGYNRLVGYFACKNGTLTIARTLGSSTLTVNSNVDGIVSGDYKDSDSKNYEKTINSVFLKMLGIQEQIKIPKNKDGSTATLSWRTIKHLMMIHESETEREATILLPSEYTSRTPFLSSLLYFLYNQDFSPYDISLSAKTKATRKAILQEYISNKIESVVEKRKRLEHKLSNLKGGDISINDISDKLEKLSKEIESKIADAVSKDQLISKDVISVQGKIRSFSLSLNRFKSLESQYQSDIKRLTFIVDNEKISHSHDENTICPFCESKISGRQESSYIESAKAELRRTISNIEDLAETMAKIKKEIKDTTIELDDLSKEKKTVNEYLNNELMPKQIKLSESLVLYRDLIEAENEIRVYDNLDRSYDKDLKDLEVATEKPLEYLPKQLFRANFYEEIAANFKEIITQMSYTPVDSCEFDKKEFEIKINGEYKGTHGKGYRALFNSTLLLGLRKYINENSYINPHFYFIDSPLHGLSIPQGLTSEENVRFGFFNYLVNNYGSDQIIIIENTNEHDLPVITDESVKVINFTQNKEVGRYGFLTGVFKE